MSAPNPVLEGQDPYDEGDRWSDYTSAAVDPSDDVTLWTLQVIAAKLDKPTGARQVQLFWVKFVPPP